MAVVQAGEVELSYERGGEGPPLLLIMGMSGTMHHWSQPLIDDLRRDFDVIAYDHRGVGESSPAPDPFTIATLAQDAAALLDALELPEAHAMGISMGGMVAQELALAQPERLRSLVLGCTYSGGEGSALTSPEVFQPLAEAMASGDRERAIRAAWEANVSAPFAAGEDNYARFLEVARVYAVALPMIMAQLSAIGGHDTSARLAEIAIPTLVIHGTDDLVLPVVNGRMIAERIPGARLEIMEGVGHLFFWERPQETAQLVREHAYAVA